jgi:hypothetical protein
MIILIPPSEGKASGGTLPPLQELKEPSLSLWNELIETQDEKLLGVKGIALERAITANKTLLSEKTLPAIERYTGVVYKGIAYSSLTEQEQTYINKHVRIVSALFGLVKPLDPLPEYKLKIDKLGAAKVWRAHTKKELKSEWVIDLLPQAHRKAVSYEKGIKVDFVIEKQGKKVPAGHQGKFIKGRFVRWLAQNNITNPEEIQKFKEEGFEWVDGCFLKRV